jgi:elongation factor P
MNAQSFEEVAVGAKIVEGMDDLIDEGMEVTLVFFKGSVIECVLPKSCTYTVTECPPNTSEAKNKPLTLSSGAIISGPGYVEVGESIKVDTEKREFLGRA